jgi:outer membrane protease
MSVGYIVTRNAKAYVSNSLQSVGMGKSQAEILGNVASGFAGSCTFDVPGLIMAAQENVRDIERSIQELEGA